MDRRQKTQTAAEPWPDTLAGVGLFAIPGLRLSLGELPHEWAVPRWVGLLSLAG